MKKVLLTSVIALAAVCSLAACGGSTATATSATENAKTETTTVQPTEEAVHVSYQFVGSYDTLASFGFVYDFLVNLNSDNKAEIYIYCNAGLENENCDVINGTWKAAKSDGEDCLELNDKINPDGKYQIFAVDGTYTIEQYYFTFAGSYSRKIDLNGSATAQYATVDAWKEYAKDRVSKISMGKYEEGDEKSSETTTESSQEAAVKATLTGTQEGNETSTATITLNDDGTGKFTCTLGGYELSDDITWTWQSYVLTITSGEEVKVTASPDGTTYMLNFTYTKSAGDYSFNYNFTVAPGVYTQQF